jgi:hypothetical protein
MEVFVGSTLRCLDRRHEGVLGAHDDDGQLRPELADARNEVECILVRHHDVGDHEVTLATLDEAPERRGIAGAAYVKSGTAQGLSDNRPDGGIIVSDDYCPRSLHHSPSTSDSTSRVVCIGSRSLNTVRLGADSHSTMPP